MSGPDYPRLGAGSNAIGSFTIGVSPIGTIPTFDWWKTVISQYANSPALTTILENFFDCLDLTADFDEFFDTIWNVDTAQGYGLDVWGRIVGVSRTLQIPNSDIYLGFEEAADTAEPFNSAPFYSGAPLTTNFDLSDEAYRLLILAKALSNISNGSVQALNQILLDLFPQRGNCYVIDGHDMTMTYVFEFALLPFELAIVENSGALPKPSGVSMSVTEL